MALSGMALAFGQIALGCGLALVLSVLAASEPLSERVSSHSFFLGMAILLSNMPRVMGVRDAPVLIGAAVVSMSFTVAAFVGVSREKRRGP